MARHYGNNSEASNQVRAQVADAARQKSTIIHSLDWIISGACLLVGVISLGVGIYTSTSGSKTLADIQAEIESQTLIMNDKKTQVSNNVTVVESAVNSAASLGNQICELQNKLNTEIREKNSNRIMVGDLTDEYEDNDYYIMPMTENHQKYLEEFRSIISAGGIDRRVFLNTWCPYGVWQFESTYTYSSDEPKTCNWSCYAVDNKGNINTDRLLAVVTMSYNPASNTFTNPSRFNTKYYYEEADNFPAIAFEDETAEDVHDRLDDSPETPSNTDEVLNTDESIESNEITEPEDNTGNTDIETDVTNGDASGSGDTENAPSADTGTPSDSTTRPVETPAEPEYFYSWSSAYGEWGYFDSDGNFYTIDEYEEMMR